MATVEHVEKLKKDGYVVVKDFLTEEEVASLREECYQLVDAMDPAEHHCTFSTTETKKQRNDYFMNSGDKIRYFFEEGALDEQGNLKVDKHKSLNKIGHALHMLCPNFKRVTFSEKVKNVCRLMNFKDPMVPQSMYIFKQPGIGGKVVPHQDATYLYTEPELQVVGMWIALEDATLDNGCLWFIPESHTPGKVYGDYRMVRNPRSDTEEACIYTGTKPDYDAEGEYVATPVQKGDLIMISGLVIHKSAQNLSDKSRHIYTFHLYDNAAGQWSPQNWQQPTEALPFPHLYEVDP